MPTMQDGLRVEVAFAADPMTSAPAWTDLTSRVRLDAGVEISRGRSADFDVVQPSRCTLTLDNLDGGLTVGHPAAFADLKPGNPVRVSWIDPVGGAVTRRFRGFVEGWPIRWPTGGDNLAITSVTAHDLLARMGRMPPLRSVIEQTILPTSPTWYFPLSEADGSTSAGDAMGTGAVLTVEQTGVDGALNFGRGTGPKTDGQAAPLLTPVDSDNGQWLRGVLPPLQGSATVAVTFAPSSTPPTTDVTILRLATAEGRGLRLRVTPTGQLRAYFWDPWTATEEGNITTPGSVLGRTHTAILTWSFGAGSVATLSLTLDGADVGSASWITTPDKLAHLEVGGGPNGRLFSGTVSHVLGWQDRPTSPALADYWVASTTGWAGERSDERVARVCSWVGVPPSWLVLDVGAVRVGHVDPTGKSPLEYLQQLASTEGGPLFIDGDGRLVMHSRDRAVTPTAAVLSTTADAVGSDLLITTDLTGMCNDLTVSRPGGASDRVVDTSSVALYGLYGDKVDVVTATDEGLHDIASWRVALGSTPRRRIPTVTLDVLTDITHASAIRALEVGSRVTVTGLPGQAPAATLDLVVQGYSEKITAEAWDVVCNTTLYLPIVPLILDDVTYGVLDSINALIY